MLPWDLEQSWRWMDGVLHYAKEISHLFHAGHGFQPFITLGSCQTWFLAIHHICFMWDMILSLSLQLFHLRYGSRPVIMFLMRHDFQPIITCFMWDVVLSQSSYALHVRHSSQPIITLVSSQTWLSANHHTCYMWDTVFNQSSHLFHIKPSSQPFTALMAKVAWCSPGEWGAQGWHLAFSVGVLPVSWTLVLSQLPWQLPGDTQSVLRQEPCQYTVTGGISRVICNFYLSVAACAVT